jgi:hypothetical protein
MGYSVNQNKPAEASSASYLRTVLSIVADVIIRVLKSIGSMFQFQVCEFMFRYSFNHGLILAASYYRGSCTVAYDPSRIASSTAVRHTMCVS